MKVPFFRLSFSKEEKKEVADVLKTGWVTSGPKVNLLEKQIIKITGAHYAAALSSGTAGLHLVLESLGIGEGDEVITTPFTMAATVEAIMYTGARPVLVDIDPVSMNIDPAAVEKKISKKTKAVISVDIAGCPCDYTGLKKITRKHKLFLITDAAHSLGAKYNGQPIGSIAHSTIFSFYSTKNITTGEGGMVVSNMKRLIDRVRHLSLHGMTSSGWKRYRGGSWRYDITDLGYKYNMSDLSAALGVGQMRRFKNLKKKRLQLALQYFKNFKSMTDSIELPYYRDFNEHSWHLFIIRIIPERWKIRRDRLIEELEKAGVGCGVHFIPVYQLSYFKNELGYSGTDFPNCENTFKCVISLPFYPDLKNAEADYVCDRLRILQNKFGK